MNKFKLGIILAFACLQAGIISQSTQAQKIATQRIITVDAANVKGQFGHVFNECVGAGRANEGLRADWQRQLRLAKQELGFRYIRFHGLLHDDMGVYIEDKQGNPHYNWQYIDELFDFLQSIKVKPFVELSFMPAALASNDKTVFWWKGNVSPPKDYKKWNALITKLTEHWTERYGAAEVASWYFEVWNEPNLSFFFTGTQADYFELYKQTTLAVKSVSKSYRVGGPSTAQSAWIPEFITYCKQNNVPLDFVSTHTYGVDRGAVDLTGQAGTVLSQNKGSVSDDMIGARRQITASAMPKLELHYTEWSASYTPSDPIHDSYHEAAYVLDKIRHASPYVNSMSYWTFTDIFEENGPRYSPFHGGFGMLNYQDIKKPVYYAYQYLNKLGDKELVAKDTSSIITKDKNGNLQALFWDFTITHPGDTVNNQVYYKRNLPSKPIENTSLNINHLSAGKYKMNVYKVGYRANDAYTTYFEMGSPAQLTKQQVATIKQANDDKPVSSATINIGANGLFERSFPMHQNDVYFVTLQKIKK